MVAANIKVFLRIRPSAKPAKAVSTSENVVTFELDKDEQRSNAKTSFKFCFDGILEMKVTQEHTFDIVAKPVIEDVLRGINGTIFAYGQTGSGKTFTITGGAERYEDRGLIPRTIAFLFEAFRRGDATYRMYVSYLEIYNDSGYDLLARDAAQKLEDLPKVQMREDEEGNMRLLNLSVNTAQKEEDALNLLFLGDTNRVVAETPMNDASTRSHCMFIIWIDSTRPDSDTVRRAKLHLVDLAGSERISKTGVEGNLQREARYINLSLHYLEQVIVALHGSQAHVPYRNSMMTSVLRDSLGGNCKTVMVGTMAVEAHHIEESMSTCRFAQRVAAIKNNASVNEELDPALLIKRLKKEVAELKDELKLQCAEDGEEEEHDVDVEECRKLVSAYLEADDDTPFVCGSAKRFQQCFQILREVYLSAEPETGAEVSEGALGSLENTVLELRQQVAKHDQEIAMLVTSLGKHGKGTKGHLQDAADGRVFIRRGGGPHPGSDDAGSAPNVATQSASVTLLDRNKAFDVFRKSVRRTESLEENHAATKRLCQEARELGARANAAREAIQNAKSRAEKIRLDRHLSSPRDADHVLPDSTEASLLRDIESHKAVYLQSSQRLQKVKGEIEQLQKVAEENKLRLQRDFEAWLLVQQSQTGSEQPQPHAVEKNVSEPQAPRGVDSGPPASGTTSVYTGHVQVDSDIAAYYAAIAELR